MKKIFSTKKFPIFIAQLLLIVQILTPVVVLAQTPTTIQPASVLDISGPAPTKVDATLLPATKDSSFGDSLKTSVQTGLKNGANDAINNIGASAGSAANSAAGGGIAGACASSVISSVAISGTIAALTAVLGVAGVPDFAPDQGLGSAFTSGTSFLDFLKVNCLDPAARAIYAKMLFKINDSVLKWGTTANKTGLLNGSTFISDVGSYFNAVAEESVGTFIARQDKNNLFAPDITRSLVQQTRNPSNNYTSDLSDRILIAACNTYTREQLRVNTKSNTSGTTGIFNGGKVDNLPSSVKQYNGAFNYILPLKAYAQTNDPNTIVVNRDAIRATRGTSQSLFGLDGANTNTSDPNAIVVNRDAINAVGGRLNPCLRKATTAAEKQAVIDDYHAKRIVVSGADYLDVFEAETEAKNNRSLAVTFAKSDSDRFKNQIAENNKLALTGSNNVGIQTCVKYDPLPAGALPGEKPTCAADGYVTTVTPQIVNSQTENSHRTSNEILQKLASTGTWKDLAQTIVTNLITNLSTQLINSATGLLSFSGKSNTSSQGAFTQSVSQLNQAGASVTELNTSVSNTNAYVSVLKSDSDAISSLIDKVTEVKNTCTELLSLYSTTYGGQRLSLVGATPVIQNHECNIDQANLNYKDDPTAAIKLANNPIYIEISQLDTLKQQLEQVNQAYQNAKSTLSTLNKTSSDYTNSQDVNKEINLSTQTSLVLGQVPQEVDVTQKQTQLTDIQNRITRIDTILSRLTQELATLKGATSKPTAQ